MFVFDCFEPGKCYGTSTFELSPQAVEAWFELFPDDLRGPLMPHGMTSVITALAYHEIITPRPPGNIHGKQRFEMFALPAIGETLQTSVTCRSKEIRKSRRLVNLDFETRMSSGTLAFRGLFTSIVAA